jgi:hypothetical protein
MRTAAVSILGLALAALATSAVAADWKAYTDDRRGWSISYPADFRVDRDYRYEIVTPSPTGVSFAVPRSMKRGTNLNEAALSVERLPGRNCRPAQFVDDPQDIAAVRADGRTYIKATGSDAGMSQYRDTTLFLVKGTCTAVRYFTHSTNPGVMDPPPREFDAARLTRLFDKMRATLKLR